MQRKKRKTAVKTADAAGWAQPAGNDHVLTIDNVAAMFKTSPLSLRLFELRGLIKRRREGSERVFSWIDCERVALLIKAGKAGVGFREIAPIVKAAGENAAPAVFNAGRERCLDLIAKLKEQQDAITDMLAELHRIDWELSVRNAAPSSAMRVRPDRIDN